MITESPKVPTTEVFADYAWNCRGVIQPHSVQTLKQDLEKTGLLQPVVVRPYNVPPYKYSLIAGFRRFTAIKALGWSEIDVRVIDVNDITARVINLKENIERSDLNIKQEADGIAHFKTAGWTVDEVAKRLNQSKGWVSTRFLLATLEPEIQMEAAAGFLSQQHIKIIATLPPGEMRFAAVRQVKEAKARSEKVDLEPGSGKSKVKNPLQRKVRGPKDIFPFVDTIFDNIGPCFATRCMAWCAGEVSDIELLRDLKAETEAAGNKFVLPESHSHVRL